MNVRVKGSCSALRAQPRVSLVPTIPPLATLRETGQERAYRGMLKDFYSKDTAELLANTHDHLTGKRRGKLPP